MLKSQSQYREKGREEEREREMVQLVCGRREEERDRERVKEEASWPGYETALHSLVCPSLFPSVTSANLATCVS